MKRTVDCAAAAKRTMDLDIEHLIYLATAISIKANPRQAALQVEVFAIPVTETRYACWILVYRKPVALEIVTKMFRKLVGSEFCKGKPGVRCDSVLEIPTRDKY